MVTTQARRPRRAASSAKAADTVVLPTPPEPQHTTMARSATSSESPIVPLGAGGSGTVLMSCPRRVAAGARRGRAWSGPVLGQGTDGVGQLRRQALELVGADPVAEEEGGLELRQGQFGSQASPLLFLEAEAVGAEGGRGRQRRGLVRRQGDPCFARRPRRRRAPAGGRRGGRR